jgi:hypothetical protein
MHHYLSVLSYRIMTHPWVSIRIWICAVSVLALRLELAHHVAPELQLVLVLSVHAHGRTRVLSKLLRSRGKMELEIRRRIWREWLASPMTRTRC